MASPFQERHHDYVLGPNQDTRLASVAPGTVIKDVRLVLDPDAPFELRSRAVYSAYTNANSVTQGDLKLLKSRWTGPTNDFRQMAFVSESAQMAYFGQFGSPKPVGPVQYPAAGVLRVDIYNASTTATITNLTFLWRGVKLFPPGAVPAYRYPAKCGLRPYNYQILVSQLGTTETRNFQIFQVKPDADFVIRGICAVSFQGASSPGPNLFFQLMDFNRKPYSNDLVLLSAIAANSSPAEDTNLQAFPIGSSSFIFPTGAGPNAPGIFYPEIYIPANHQMLFNISRADGSLANQSAEDTYINLVGVKVFPQ